ncbi:DoxX family protein [Nesterenkonia xinjiangensis]|uniref:Putative oxidoreductase n=1 Tax=Nesterenkonia xinjiangensis TaxID=225327 RepID=A0A7Z0GL79_9MICC|nr:DoxX family protein [Nesterenkonia xinjiangensis]NYJ77191.1 putative oxidoreductase [Nesterenkonia xinjiangensis]
MRTLLNPAAAAPALTDLALLIARVALGVILVAHGWQKFDEWTVAGTAASFEGMGVPVPSASAVIVTGAELVGGVLLILGLLTPIVALINAVSMLVALFLVHAPAGLFVSEGGYELVLALFAGLIILAATGAGRFSLDRLIAPARRRRAKVRA